MPKLNGSAWAWIRTTIIVASCMGTLVYGYGAMDANVKAVKADVVNVERETDAARAEYRMVMVKLGDRMRSLEREVVANSTKLDMLLHRAKETQ